MPEQINWLAADSTFNVWEYNGNNPNCTIEELVANSNGTLWFEYEDSEEFYRNVCSNSPFTLNGSPSNLIGGTHSPQRPK